MATQRIKSTRKNRILSSILILFIFMFIGTQVECIKFGRKGVAQVQQAEHDKGKDSAGSNSDKVGSGKVDDNKPMENVKSQTVGEKELEKVKEEKTPDINEKPQQTSTSPKLEAQQMPLSSTSSSHAVDSLFGEIDQSTKTKTQNKPLTITPEQTILAKKSQPSTVPQVQPAQEAPPKQSTLGELFESNNQKNVQSIKKQQQKTQTYIKEIPTTVPAIQNKKEEEKKQIKNVQNTKKNTEQQVSDEKKDNKNQKQSQDQDQNDDKDQVEEQSQDDDIIYSKNSKKPNKKEKKALAQPHKESEIKYSFTLLLTFLLYSFIIVMVIITIKCTSKSSRAAKAVNIMVDAVGDAFKKKQGYRPALNEEEITEREDQITVGYRVDDNKQIFWEKNSVQGI